MGALYKNWLACSTACRFCLYRNDLNLQAGFSLRIELSGIAQSHNLISCSLDSKDYKSYLVSHYVIMRAWQQI